MNQLKKFNIREVARAMGRDSPASLYCFYAKVSADRPSDKSLTCITLVASAATTRGEGLD